ncbi:hypothetical protein MTR67_007349 [Solanum verrucosum]|uniref:Endonuclease/exonuclease/phosphatase domain-containing protein n=1 Tax=Solanum verrucosum TaxID=315347 RepID=A0AAF0PZI5_SOLVR|nr:hypothetical protein MTR67_007349 [Solanum verrucosum]
MKLVDLQLEDVTYTWFKGDQHEAASRIDRILISEKWDDKFQNLKQIPLQRLISDHIPIALLGGSWERNKVPSNSKIGGLNLRASLTESENGGLLSTSQGNLIIDWLAN